MREITLLLPAVLSEQFIYFPCLKLNQHTEFKLKINHVPFSFTEHLRESTTKPQMLASTVALCVLKISSHPQQSLSLVVVGLHLVMLLIKDE